MPKNRKFLFCRIAAVLLTGTILFSSCSHSDDETPAETVPPFTDEDLAAQTGININFPDLHPEDPQETEAQEGQETAPPSETEDPFPTVLMQVCDQMELYHSTTSDSPETVLTAGEKVMLKESQTSGWTEVYFVDGPLRGYTRDGFHHAMNLNSEVYGELPVEYGMARTNANTYVKAYSHLVDVGKYFKAFYSTSELSGAADFSEYDLVVSMKLSTSDTSIGKPFYKKNLCMVQYDLLPMLKKAVDMFAKDGYRIVIYDAYRPTSVQQRWFDVVKVHKWVANPAIGMGGVHDRGTALDISLIDTNGNLLEMPTPMHTFTEESARNSPTMTETARNNMNYMLNVMVQCGFTYINSEWWHFQDVDTQYYLPTDHPIDEIPLVPSEPTEIGTISY